EAYLAVGLVDTTCSPTSIFAAYNAIPGKKHITVYPYNGHRNSVSKAFVSRLEKILARTEKE
ncbi:MAG: acetylxylan esterase, partial [Lentisphaeria bacterium]|nr:acetylxylan esterase [Lentisphaeria bacterium]